MSEEKRRYLFRLIITHQGHSYTADTWRAEDAGDVEGFRAEAMAHLAQHLDDALSEGVWGFEISRTWIVKEAS